MIDFETEGLLSINVFTNRTSFPVAVAAYSERDVAYINCLQNNIHYHDTESICHWCKSHDISFRIIYRASIAAFLASPLRFFEYILLCKKIS